MSPFVIGLDVGGANLKAANTEGEARSQPFELWKNPDGLGAALRRLMEGWRWPEQFAVTMTGELCDCFETKREGVAAILDAVQGVAGATPVRVWTNQGRFVDLLAAKADAPPCAAANWLALATFAGRFAPLGRGLLFDIGSTTSDLVALDAGRPAPRGRTDTERLRSHELVYTGVRRTPLCAVLGAEVAAEWFATTRDVYLLLGQLPEDAADCNTADGRPATRSMACARIARMKCADAETTTWAELKKLAERVLLRQCYLLGLALAEVVEKLPDPPKTVIVSGEGEFLAQLVVKQEAALHPCQVLSLGKQLGPEISRAACAYAVAMLAAEGR